MHGPLQCPLTAESRAPLLHCARRSDSLPAPTRAPAARLPPEYFSSTSPVRRAEHAWPRRSARFEFHGAARATSPASALSIASPPDVRCLATSPVQHWPPIHATIRRTASTGFRCALQARALPVMRQHERMLPSPVVALLPPRQSAHRLHCRTSRFHDLSPAVLSSHSRGRAVRPPALRQCYSRFFAQSPLSHGRTIATRGGTQSANCPHAAAPTPTSTTLRAAGESDF